MTQPISNSDARLTMRTENVAATLKKLRDLEAENDTMRKAILAVVNYYYERERTDLPADIMDKLEKAVNL